MKEFIEKNKDEPITKWIIGKSLCCQRVLQINLDTFGNTLFECPNCFKLLKYFGEELIKEPEMKKGIIGGLSKYKKIEPEPFALQFIEDPELKEADIEFKSDETTQHRASMGETDTNQLADIGYMGKPQKKQMKPLSVIKSDVMNRGRINPTIGRK